MYYTEDDLISNTTILSIKSFVMNKQTGHPVSPPKQMIPNSIKM